MAASVSVLFTIRDAKGETSQLEVHLPSTLSLAQWTGFASQCAVLIDAVIGGAITRVGIVIAVTLPGGIKSAALTNSDVEEGAKFQFATAGGFRTGFRIPTFLETLIASNSRAVDLEDADVAALVNAIEEGLTVSSVVIQPSDGRDDDVVALTSAKEQFLSSRA